MVVSDFDGAEVSRLFVAVMVIKTPKAAVALLPNVPEEFYQKIQTIRE